MVLIVSMQIYVNGHDHCMGLYQENNVSILEELCENKKMPFYDLLYASIDSIYPYWCSFFDST
jgi:hypothetical protein